MIDSLRQQLHLGRFSRIRRIHVASQGTLVTSNMKSGRRVLAKERNSVIDNTARARVPIERRHNRTVLKTMGQGVN
jgi:hypothetical protein